MAVKGPNRESLSSVAHVKTQNTITDLNVAATYYFLRPAFLPYIHTPTHACTVLLPGREELPEMCFNLPNNIPQKPWQPPCNSECALVCVCV